MQAKEVSPGKVGGALGGEITLLLAAYYASFTMGALPSRTLTVALPMQNPEFPEPKYA